MNISTCPRCDMTFKSLRLLEKHKEKFCIGGNVTRPMNTFATPKDMAERLNMMRHFKQRKLPEDLKKTQPPKEFKSRSEPTGITDPPTMDGHNSQIRDLTMYQGKQLADLSNATKQLEKKNREIDFKLYELAAQRKAVSEMEKMLLDLKAQEERNSNLLESMMAQLLILQGDPRQHMTLEEESQSKQTNPQVSPPTCKENVLQTFVPIYMSGLLSSEISNLHLSYLQHGGSSQQVLSQLQELLHEALQLEMHHGKQSNPKTHQRHRIKRRYDSEWCRINKQLIATEMENQRLEEEIRNVQLKKSKVYSFTRSTQMGPPRGQDIQAMKMNIDLLKHEIEINRLRRQIRSRKTSRSQALFPSLEEVRSQTPALTRYLHEQADALGPAPYDPMAGFVVFYDFILGLSPTYRLCRLTVGLFSGDQALGALSLLPPVYCELAISLSSSLPTEQRRGQLAVLATKQAVPRVHPSPALSLVLHLQASGGHDVMGQEVTGLVSRGWVKVDVFDQHNRIISGRWRVPLRVLPAKPSMTTGEMNTVPQLESAELYLRVVNARDADTQSSIPISLNMAAHYRFPPVVTRIRCLTSPNGIDHDQDGQARFPAFFETTDLLPPPDALSGDQD